MTSTLRPSDRVFESLNRFEEAKKTGVLGPKELSDLLISIGTIYSNQVKNGNVNGIEDFEAFLPKTNMFTINHQDLDVAYTTIVQGNAAALYDRKNRFGFVKKL